MAENVPTVTNIPARRPRPSNKYSLFSSQKYKYEGIPV